MSILRCETHGSWDSDFHEHCPACDCSTALSEKDAEAARLSEDNARLTKELVAQENAYNKLHNTHEHVLTEKKKAEAARDELLKAANEALAYVDGHGRGLKHHEATEVWDILKNAVCNYEDQAAIERAGDGR